MKNTDFTFSDDRKALLRNGKEFYRPSMIGCRDGVNCALLLNGSARNLSHSDGKADVSHVYDVVIGTGNCCHGYLVFMNEHGVIDMQSLDFNVCGFHPVVHTVKSRCGDGKEYQVLGFLAWGAGCDGSGIRFISGIMDGLPKVVTIVSSEEGGKAYNSWFYMSSVLNYPGLWEKLEAAGVKADVEATKKLCESNVLLRSR